LQSVAFIRFVQAFYYMANRERAPAMIEALGIYLVARENMHALRVIELNI